jgi:glutathione reductase (NADPH)
LKRPFDAIVIGTGSAAGTVASRCRAAGWSVVMIDKQPVGGTCALRGCDPKKVLVGAAAAVDQARAFAGKGVRAGGLAIDWTELARFKRTFTDPLPDKRKAALERAGIDVIAGTARFVGPSAIAVGSDVFEARRAIVIAAGSRPATLPIEGREHLATSDEFLNLPALPASVAFVGGGYISFEFAHVAARAGARATILHRGARPLSQFDPDLVDRLVASTRGAGIDVRLRTDVCSIEMTGGVRHVVFHEPAGTARLDTDLVVHGAGRVPDIDDLALNTGGVQFSLDGIRVSERLQSVSNPLVWAAGDCAATDGPALTPVAGYEGRVVAANLLESIPTAAEYEAIPSVVFTIPPLAAVGLTEAGARARDLEFSARLQDTSSWYSSRRLAEAFSGSKVLVEHGTGRILGAHLLGPHADETINLFALAMRAGVTADRFKQVLWAYPTHASDTPYMT